MKFLSENEMDFIRKDLRKKGLKDVKLTEEILDHICCIVEDQLNQGVAFNQAYQYTLEGFGDRGISTLQKEKNQLKLYQWKKYLGLEYATVFILLAVLIFFARDGKAQGHPDIAPYQSTEKMLDRSIEKSKRGVKFEVPAGIPVVATAKGKVNLISNKSLSIQHEGEIRTHYENLMNFVVKEGDWVNKGDIIAYVAEAKTEFSYLYYQITFQGKEMNPLDFFAE